MKFLFYEHLLNHVLLVHSFMDCSFARTVVQTDSIFSFFWDLGLSASLAKLQQLDFQRSHHEFVFWYRIFKIIIRMSKLWTVSVLLNCLGGSRNELTFKGNQTWVSFRNFWKPYLENYYIPKETGSRGK